MILGRLRCVSTGCFCLSCIFNTSFSLLLRVLLFAYRKSFGLQVLNGKWKIMTFGGSLKKLSGVSLYLTMLVCSSLSNLWILCDMIVALRFISFWFYLQIFCTWTSNVSMLLRSWTKQTEKNSCCLRR